MTAVDDVSGYIDTTFPQHLERIRAFLRIPGISLNRSRLREVAAHLEAWIRELGGTVTMEGAADAPLLCARINVGAPKTLVVYGMYDVQPVEGQPWSSDPFAAEIHTLPGNLEECVIARGACNSKGPLAAFLNALGALRARGGIPVNLIFTLDGEEEIGSPQLRPFYELHRAELSKANAGFEPFWADYGTDVQGPTMALGCKGVSVLHLRCASGVWGGPGHDVHSSVAGLIASPAWRLIRALDSLVDENDTLAVDGLNAAPVVGAEDLTLLTELARVYDWVGALATLGAARFKTRDAPVDLLTRYLFSPSLHPGPIKYGDGDVVPPEASVDLVLRLPPGMAPDWARAQMREHLDRRGYSEIEIEQGEFYPGSRTSMREPVVRCMLDTYNDFGVTPQIWPLMASATPYYLFSEILKIPWVCGGLGKAGRSHAPNEYATVDGLKVFEKSIARFLLRFAET